MLINLLRGEIRLWFYVSEPLCQRIVADLGKTNNVVAALAQLKPILRRTVDSLKTAALHPHLSTRIHIISDKPNLNHTTPQWLKHAGHHLGEKLASGPRRSWHSIFRISRKN